MRCPPMGTHWQDCLRSFPCSWSATTRPFRKLLPTQLRTAGRDWIVPPAGGLPTAEAKIPAVCNLFIQPFNAAERHNILRLNCIIAEERNEVCPTCQQNRLALKILKDLKNFRETVGFQELKSHFEIEILRLHGPENGRAGESRSVDPAAGRSVTFNSPPDTLKNFITYWSIYAINLHFEILLP